MKYVLDSNISLKWVLTETDSDKAWRLRSEFQNQIHELLAPDVFPVEVTHGLAKAERRGVVPQGDADRLLTNVLSPPQQFHPYLPLLKRALDIASPARIGVYDCLYVALAEREGCELLTADDRLVNALPPLKVVQLLGNACLSPATLAPKGPFRPRGPKRILWFSLDSVEPHRVTSNDLVGALGAIPAAWWRTSHDVLARLMFSSRADSFSPANRLHPHYQRANSIVPGAGSLSRIVCNNHHSFTYAASVA